MRPRSLIAAGSLAVVIATVWAARVAVAGQTVSTTAETFTIPTSTYDPPKTPWGDPDLQGVWDNHSRVPMQRPANLAGKKTFTDAELADYLAVRTLAGGQRRPDGERVCLENDVSCAAATVDDLDVVGAYNRWWAPRYDPIDNRTALIEDPPDGRIPPLTPEARARQEEYERSPAAAADVIRHWTEFDARTRCIAVPVPTAIQAYNSAHYIMQSPGWVLIVQERLNTRVIPLDGRPHLGQDVRSWLGDSRGHWEGDTLVVETTNFVNDLARGGPTAIPSGIALGNIRLVEHFVPVGPNRLHYYATLEDPQIWIGPWTFMQPWEKDRMLAYDDALGSVGQPEPYQIYEYACHEGNLSVGGTLKGTIALAERAANKLPASATVSSLIGRMPADVRATFGAPPEIEGPRWVYETRDGVLTLYVYFEDGNVVRVRPDDLPLDQVVKTR